MQPAPQVSANFGHTAALDWLHQISELNMILSTILGVIHLQLYQACQETLNHLRQNPKIECQDVLQKWTSVFNGISVICNCTSLAHWDSESQYH